MKIYSQIVLQFVYPEKLRKLQLVLTKYRIHIAKLSITYKFKFIRDYNATFVRQRILLDQDDPIVQSAIDSQFNDRLLRKADPNKVLKHTSDPTFKSVPNLEICRNFNEGRYTRKHCRYSYICLNCQQNYPTNACQKTQSSTLANANYIPLSSRVSKAD